MSQFLFHYHRLDPQTVGAQVVSRFWLAMTVGSLIGAALLKLFDSRRVLIGATLCALVSLSAALFGPATVTVVAFPAIGLFASAMWPIIFSLALNSVTSGHGAFAGILCTGVVGAAAGLCTTGRIGASIVHALRNRANHRGRKFVPGIFAPGTGLHH